MKGQLALLALAIGFAPSACADTMRCGSQLISVGERAFEVLERCGEPTYRDLIGYSLAGNEQRELKVEEWVYGPTNGMLRILTFEGNRLTRIESRRKR